MKRLLLSVCVCMVAFSAYTQEDGEIAHLRPRTDTFDDKISLSLDVASGFVWRGMAFNTSPVVQPEIAFALGNFSIGAWASVPFSPGEYKEFDVFLFYDITSSLSIGLTDYFDNSPRWWFSPSYFNYKKEETSHSLDFQLMYDGSGGFPFKFMASTIIAGDDLKIKDGKVKQNFSTYLELGYGNTTRNGIDWDVFIGFVPMKSDFYDISGAGFMNVGFGVTKNFEITPTYTLPLSLKLSVNPAYEAVFLTASVALFR